MFRSLSIGAKLGLSFGLLFVLVAGLGAFSLYELRAVYGTASELRDTRLPAVQTLGRIQVLVLRQRVNGGRLITADTPTLRADVAATIAKRDGELAALQAAYLRQPIEAEARTQFVAFETQWKAYATLQAEIAAKAASGELSDAQRIYNTAMSTGISAVLAELQKLIDLNDAAARRSGLAAETAYDEANRGTLLLVGLVLVMAIGAALLLALNVGRPLRSMTATMKQLAAGDTGVAIPGVERRDEVGAMAGAVQVFKDGMIAARALEDETALARAGAEEQRKAAMQQMADTFEMAVGGIVGGVTAAATELQATAQSMTATATQTASQSTTVAAAAAEAASNVNTVAAAAEELGSSVQEIGRQVGGSSDLAQGAVAEAARTAIVVQELSEAASRIGDVVAMISTIAGQTNLLALNATIEAARAGEAGRGFAVVAAEVKELASQTARATEEIGGQIGRIQGSTRQAVQAIDAIAGRIREISGVSASIAAAVEEQGAATQEIVRNVSQAAMGTEAVTTTIGGVADAAEETGAAAAQVLASASELSRQSEHLNAEMSRVLATLRAA